MLLFAPSLAGGLGIDHRCDRVRLPRRTHQEKNFIRVNSRDSRPTSLEVVPSPQAAIALPLDRGVGGDIYLERAIFADASLFAFKRNPVMAWRERHAKPSITVRRKFGCDGIRLGLHNKRRICERFRGRLVYSNWPRVPRTDRNRGLRRRTAVPLEFASAEKLTTSREAAKLLSHA